MEEQTLGICMSQVRMALPHLERGKQWVSGQVVAKRRLWSMQNHTSSEDCHPLDAASMVYLPSTCLARCN